MTKAFFVLHRYLGILFGIVVSLWCLSAFVMMYVRYPSLDEAEALRGLAVLDFSACCAPSSERLADAGPLRSFRIEMTAGRPTLRLAGADGGHAAVDLRTGGEMPNVDGAAARREAVTFLRNAGALRSDHDIGEGERVVRDQWTVAGGFDGHRPLYRFAAGDAASTEVYVSGITGEVVQQTTGRERFWNRLGSVIHWLYLVPLRRHADVWQQVVIWTSIAGAFLVGIGVYIGWRQYRTGHNGGRSPYRGAALWHHYSGLLFGVLALAWIGSGLLSVNPWGLLESGSAAPDHRRLAGGNIEPRAVTELLRRLGRTGDLPGAVRIESAPFAGEFALLAYLAGGGVSRLDPVTFASRPLSSAALNVAADILAPAGGAVDSAELLLREDNYYFTHHETVSLPVYRVVLADAGRTRYYVDPASGRLLQKVDSDRRWSRWLFEAVHRGDFARWSRRRPVRDLLLLLLLAGVAVSAITGTALGLRRLSRELRGATAAMRKQT